MADCSIPPDAHGCPASPSYHRACAEHRLPAVYQAAFGWPAGGLMSYGADRVDRTSAGDRYVDRILARREASRPAGAAPTKFEPVFNLKTAKALGLDVPPTLLATRRRGDRMKTARVHHAARRRGGDVAVRGAGAATGDAGDRLSQQQVAPASSSSAVQISARVWRESGYTEGRNVSDRISLGEW